MTDNLLKFPLRPSASQLQERSIFEKLKDMNVHQAFVLGVDDKGYPSIFCDPQLGIAQAVFLLESARFRLMSGRPIAPPPSPGGPA